MEDSASLRIVGYWDTPKYYCMKLSKHVMQNIERKLSKLAFRRENVHYSVACNKVNPSWVSKCVISMTMLHCV